MIPATYHLALYAGDTYHGPTITLPDLSPFGGPSSLEPPVEVRATLRRRSRDASGADLVVEILSAAERRLRLTLPASEAANLPSEGVWDLQVRSGDWVGTPIAGKFTVRSEVSR